MYISLEMSGWSQIMNAPGLFHGSFYGNAVSVLVVLAFLTIYETRYTGTQYHSNVKTTFTS